MKNLKFYLAIGIFVINQSWVYSQDIKGEINKALSGYIIPVLLLGIICGAIVGLIRNWDLIEDSTNSGTRTKGLLNAGWYVLYAFIIIAVIGSIVTAVKSINIQI
jgi:H+/Cl- antiporter ClcA